MNTIKWTTAVVTGARHLRGQRNGQDAAAAWTGAGCRLGNPAGVFIENPATVSGTVSASAGPSACEWVGEDLVAAAEQVSDTISARRDIATRRAAAGADSIAVVVVADGCSSGASSEVGARLGATMFARAVGRRLAAGMRVDQRATWEAARADVTGALAELLERIGGDRVAVIREQLLFTIVAGAVTADGAAVWAIGDGAFSFGRVTRELGPFADNAPPYLAYDLIGTPGEAAFEVAPAACETIIVATDGVTDLACGIEGFADDRFLANPDALRRHLAVMARGEERVDWEGRRVVRTPAVLQDDCAVGVLRVRRAS